jgi:hypothetical protein
MTKITADALGTFTHQFAITDARGTGLLPMQCYMVDGSGTATFDILGRVAPDGPWFPLKEGLQGGFLEAISWVPYVALRITALSNGAKVALHVAHS